MCVCVVVGAMSVVWFVHGTCTVTSTWLVNVLVMMAHVLIIVCVLSVLLRFMVSPPNMYYGVGFRCVLVVVVVRYDI